MTGAYAHPSAGDAGAVYIQIRNAGRAADTLLAAAGPDSARAMLMTTSGGHMAMQPSLVIGGGERLLMRPGGVHLMFSGIKGDYKIGDTLRVRLRFARAGAVSVAAPVVPFGEMPD